MTTYALVKIRRGARCAQDHSLYIWPPSDYGEEGKSLAGVSDDAVFIGKKLTSGHFQWDCKAHGAGMIGGDYGNGSILVRGQDSVELLTPMLAFEPELPPEDPQADKADEQESLPETIYLIPHADGYLWCEDPAPGEGMAPAESVKYIRADKHQEIIDQQAKAAKMGMDAAKKSAMIMEQSAKRMLAESSPEAIESERAANAVLTDRIEELEAMVEVFLGCIETGRLPAEASRCHKMICELVGESEGGGKR